MIAPSLLSANFLKLQEEIKDIEASGAKILHLDVMDGHFVPNISFGPFIIKQLRQVTNLFFDTHLMLDNSDLYIDIFHQCGSDAITVPVEANIHLNRTLARIKDLGIKAGVAINPATPIILLDEVIDIADIFLIMSVNPGFGGQKLINGCINKISQLKEKIIARNSHASIHVDGGVTEDNAGLLWGAGADVLVAGSSFFSEKDYKIAVQKMGKR